MAHAFLTHQDPKDCGFDYTAGALLFVVGFDDLEGLFQPEQSYDSMKIGEALWLVSANFLLSTGTQVNCFGTICAFCGFLIFARHYFPLHY